MESNVYNACTVYHCMLRPKRSVFVITTSKILLEGNALNSLAVDVHSHGDMSVCIQDIHVATASTSVASWSVTFFLISQMKPQTE